MPTNPERFFEDPKESSRYKVELLRDYARPFFYKLGSRYPLIWIVDGYAGPGVYEAEGGSAAQMGSPLVTAQVAHQVMDEGHRSELRIVNVERNGELFARLRDNLRGYEARVTNLLGSFESRADEILQLVGNDPVLFFIDPFGMEGADLRVIDRLITRKARTVTELLINFSYRGFQRMAGNLTERSRSPAREKAAATKVTNLDAMLGDGTWRWIWNDDTLTPEEKCAAVAKKYRASLRGREIEHVHPVRMRDTFYGPTRYELVFATRSSHGVYLMSDFVARYERELFNAAHTDISLEPQIREQENEERRGGLRRAIHDVGLDRRLATPGQITRALAPTHFGLFTERDYMRCLRELVREGGILRDTDKGIEAAEKLRFIPLRQPDLFGSLEGSLGSASGNPSGSDAAESA